MFFAPFGLIFSSICLKTVHFNLRFLIFILGLLWCIFPAGGAYFYSILEAEENPPFLYQRIDYQIAKNICAISGYAFRVIETSICFERLLATVYFKTYEKNKMLRFYSIFAVIVSLTVAASFSLLFNIFHISAVVVYVFLFSVETINFFLLHILKKQNYKLRQMSNSERALLTSKYQLIENIKSLNLLIPQASISFVLSNFALILSILIREFYKEALGVTIFFSFYGINVIVMSLYWISRSQWYKRNFNRFQTFWFNFKSGTNNSTEIVHLKAITVQTALGQNVKARQTAEEYFKDLKHVWN
uniref:Gustatory receptor n=1 Tax=Panagrolaimus davidi TaxID=227884 RepID=A0A914NZ39_9BILA